MSPTKVKNPMGRGTQQIDAGEGPMKSKVPMGKEAPNPRPDWVRPNDSYIKRNDDKPRSA